MHVLMRDEKEGRKKQARSNKQQGKVTQHTQSSHFTFLRKTMKGTKVAVVSVQQEDTCRIAIKQGKDKGMCTYTYDNY